MTSKENNGVGIFKLKGFSDVKARILEFVCDLKESNNFVSRSIIKIGGDLINRAILYIFIVA